ncbi:hypothetical protein IID27_03080 [Patescibacteria group bacterium]|nr:hypothetical protein [Patescibacteria group bacterium]
MDEQEQQNTVSSDDQEASQVAPTPLSPPPSHKKLLIGIVAVFVLVVAGTVGVYFLLQPKAQSVDDIQTAISENDVEPLTSADDIEPESVDVGCEREFNQGEIKLEPSIFICDPKEGDIFPIGSKQKFSWNFEGQFEAVPFSLTFIWFECAAGGSSFHFLEPLHAFEVEIKDIPKNLEWTVPTNSPDREDCRIRIEYLSDFVGHGPPEFHYSTSSPLFRVVTPDSIEPFLKIKTPRGGETLRLGQTYTISWEKAKLSSPVEVTLFKDDTFIDRLFDYSTYDTSFDWEVNYYPPRRRWKGDLKPGSDYYIVISTEAGSLDSSSRWIIPDFESSSGYFNIVK